MKQINSIILFLKNKTLDDMSKFEIIYQCYQEVYIINNYVGRDNDDKYIISDPLPLKDSRYINRVNDNISDDIGNDINNGIDDNINDPLITFF